MSADPRCRTRDVSMIEGAVEVLETDALPPETR
jgi:hypothetical protein